MMNVAVLALPPPTSYLTVTGHWTILFLYVSIFIPSHIIVTMCYHHNIIIYTVDLLLRMQLDLSYHLSNQHRKCGGCNVASRMNEVEGRSNRSSKSACVVRGK